MLFCFSRQSTGIGADADIESEPYAKFECYLWGPRTIQIQYLIRPYVFLRIVRIESSAVFHQYASDDVRAVQSDLHIVLIV